MNNLCSIMTVLILATHGVFGHAKGESQDGSQVYSDQSENGVTRILVSGQIAERLFSFIKNSPKKIHGVDDSNETRVGDGLDCLQSVSYQTVTSCVMFVTTDGKIFANKEKAEAKQKAIVEKRVLK